MACLNYFLLITLTHSSKMRVLTGEIVKERTNSGKIGFEDEVSTPGLTQKKVKFWSRIERKGELLNLPLSQNSP
jgi:hypothetical protein